MATTEAASDSQLSYVRDLLRDRDTDRLTLEQRDWLENQFEFANLNRGQASRIIDALKTLPKTAEAQEAKTRGGPEGVPNGRYAVTEPDGILRFYKVNSPTDGKWAGYTFVEVQASDELYPLKDRTRRTTVLALIAEDVQAAMLRYGVELGQCGHCGRTLTNELSRELGIGPICRGKMGW
jgi:hypothetical protein